MTLKRRGGKTALSYASALCTTLLFVGNWASDLTARVLRQLNMCIRAATWSLKELEIKYNAEVEKTAILQGEVAAKAALMEEVQRLKDELRGTNCSLPQCCVTPKGISILTSLLFMFFSRCQCRAGSDEIEPSTTQWIDG